MHVQNHLYGNEIRHIYVCDECHLLNPDMDVCKGYGWDGGDGNKVGIWMVWWT